MNPTDLQPTTAAQRLGLLDAVRAVALLGILLMNIEAFNGSVLQAGTGIDPSLSGADRWVDRLIYFFIQGKFFTLFSLLFGMGFAVMAGRAQAAGRGFAGFYFRRSAVLLGIGLLHALLIWSGDILVSYALVGVCLLPFWQANARWMLFPGILVFLAGPAMLLAYGLLAWVMGQSPESAAVWNEALEGQFEKIGALVAQADQVYASGTWLEALEVRAQEWLVTLSGLPLMGALVLGMFLIGAALVRSGAMVEPAVWPRLFSVFRWVLLPVGIAVMALSCWVAPHVPLDSFTLTTATGQALWMLASGLMCLGYLGWLVKLFTAPAGQRISAWLAPAGRMALSNYLLQSIVCTLIFYSYGLGWYGQMPRALQPVLVLGLFVLQVWGSRLWLTHFRFGPVEWIWRSLTYLRLQPMRASATA